MRIIHLLQPTDTPNTYRKIRTVALIQSSSRKIVSDNGVEIEEGIQNFIINRRRGINTGYLVQWQDQTFRVTGIAPHTSPVKLRLICELEEREVITQAPIPPAIDNALAIGDNIVVLDDNYLTLG